MTFTYTVRDDDGEVSNAATVTVDVTAAENIAPVAVNDAPAESVAIGGSLVINVLSNDNDSDGTLDETSVVTSVTSAVARADGTIIYTPPENTNVPGSVTFTYTVRDNDDELSNVASVTVSVIAAESGNAANDELIIQHRNGQTFITWDETTPFDGYHVYRHSAPINASNLSAAQKITTRWGPLDSDTSVNGFGSPHAPANFVIQDLGPELSDDTGLFVYTTQPGDSASAYYAVTAVSNGVESIASLMTVGDPVSESVQAPRDVLTLSINGGNGRLYTQYMDYSQWNPTFNGYIYNYTVALPSNYNPSRSYSLMVEPHAHSETNKFVE